MVKADPRDYNILALDTGISQILSSAATISECLENQPISRENESLIAGQCLMMGGNQFGFGDFEQSTAK